MGSKAVFAAIDLKRGARGPTDPLRYETALQAGSENNFTRPSYKKCQAIRTLRNVNETNWIPEYCKFELLILFIELILENC